MILNPLIAILNGDDPSMVVDEHGALIESIQPMPDGSLEFVSHGQVLEYAAPNHIGGIDHFDAHRSLIGSSQPSAIDGDNIFSSGHDLVGHISHNVFGGVNLLDEHHNIISESKPNIFGGQDVYEDGNLVASIRDSFFQKYWK